MSGRLDVWPLLSHRVQLCNTLKVFKIVVVILILKYKNIYNIAIGRIGPYNQSITSLYIHNLKTRIIIEIIVYQLK